MTNERAVELLHRLQDEQFDGVHGDERREALEMAVRALEGDGDTISRQAAIDALGEQIRQCDKALSVFDISMKDAYAVKVERASLVEFRETLEYMPSAQPEPRWTPCSEKLPLTYEGDIPVVEAYIVTVSVDGALFVDKAYSFGTYIDGFWDTVNDWDEGNDVHVFAWMPLPDPYKEEQE